MMMARNNRCQCCGRMFVPDRRVGVRQKACSAVCRKARKSESNRRFRRKNPDYWRGRYEIVKAWRKSNPDYQKIWWQRGKEHRMGLKPSEIQAEMFAKALDAVQENIFQLREIQAKMTFQLIDSVERFASSSC